MSNNHKVIIIDDDEAVRNALRLLLVSVGHQVEVFPSAQDYLDHYDGISTGCMILDIRMPGMSGLDLQEKLNELNSPIQIIFMTGHGDVQMAVQAMKRGAVDFLEKPFRDQDLIDRVNQVLEKIKNDEEIIKEQSAIQQRLSSLTSREKDVMEFLLQGKANKVIAIELGISTRTVEAHRASLLKKMKMRNVSELIQKMMSV